MTVPNDRLSDDILKGNHHFGNSIIVRQRKSLSTHSVFEFNMRVKSE